MQRHATRSEQDGGRTVARPRSTVPTGEHAPLAEMHVRANAGPHATSLAAVASLVAQRKCADCERVKETMGSAAPVQRAAASSGGGGLPDGLRAGLESLSGRDLSGVRVHYGSAKPAQLAAHAYAQGHDIHLAPGQERHLPHEGWHAVQQMEGRVRPTTQLLGTGINDDASLEREADVMGARAARMGTAQRTAAGSGPPGRGGRAGASPHAPVQRVKAGKAVFNALIDFYLGIGQRPGRTLLKHPLAQALNRVAFKGHEVELLAILKEWSKDGKLAGFKSWLPALRAAQMQLNADESAKKRTPEEQERREKNLAALLGGLKGADQRMVEEDLDSDDEERLGGMFPDFLEQASQTTDVYQDALGESDEEELVPLPVRRRKQHKGGHADLPGYEVRYRSYTGYISPKPNAFVMGELDQDYGPLLRDLVAAIGVETQDRDHPLTDRDVAALFLQEFEGQDAFAGFSEATRRLAHKVISIIFFAELSRHSIALLTAASSFFSVATRPESRDSPGLVESFATGSSGMRPLFAGSGGPTLMRGGIPDEMQESAVEQRRVRATMDISNYFKATGGEGEGINDFIKRRTLHFLFNLAGNTDEQTVKAAKVESSVYRYLRQVRPAQGGGTALDTLAALGLVRHAMPGDENDCAIYTLHDQLERAGVPVGAFAPFRDHVRAPDGVEGFGAMIDLVNNGGALIAAAQDYIANTLHLPAPGMAIDVWAATDNGGLMEFQNVAQRPPGDGGDNHVLTFYYNGVNHFDSLTGDLARH